MTETIGNIVSTEKTKRRGSGQSRQRKAKRCGILVMEVGLFTRWEETTKHLKHNIPHSMMWKRCGLVASKNKIRGAGSGHKRAQ